MKIKDMITICDLLEVEFIEPDELQADDGTWLDLHEVFFEIGELLRKLQWIPVSERLPEHEECVLVTTTEGEVTYARYWHKEQLWVKVLAMMNVIAWMPFPEPFKRD